MVPNEQETKHKKGSFFQKALAQQKILLVVFCFYFFFDKIHINLFGLASVSLEEQVFWCRVLI